MGCCLSSEVEDDDAIVGDRLKDNMLREIKGDVFSKYEEISTIGTGSMGDIKRARIRQDKQGGSAYNPKKKGFFGFKAQQSSSASSTRHGEPTKQFALKTIILKRISEAFIEELHNEIAILRSLDHPNIIKAYEVYSNKSQIYIVMEICSGGDLYKRLPYSEKDAAKIVGKLTSAIKYMHDNNVVHRDLKFENIMFENVEDEAEIKVIDFGLSKKFLPDSDRYMTEGVGTIYTMAPQVLQGIYTSQADLWSIGVIAFMLLSSQKPFYHKRRKRVIDKIMRCDYTFRGAIWDLVSPEAKDYCSSLIVLDPKRRLNAAQALSHKWLSRDFALSDRRPPEDVMKGVEGSLLDYKDSSDLKKVALNVIAHQSSTDKILQLRKAFDQYDSTNDGVITFDEFQRALKSCNYTEDQLTDIFCSIDVNDNGVIMYTEFLAAAISSHGAIEEERIAEAFDRIDSDDSGFISRANLEKLLGNDSSPERIDTLIEEADKDKDGKISFQEFLDIFRKDRSDMAVKLAHIDSQGLSESDHAPLLGLDAKIPGGKYDFSQHQSSIPEGSEN